MSGRVGSQTRVFFVTTFALSWFIWLPLVVIRLDVVRSGIADEALVALALPGVLMPAVAAIWLTGCEQGRAGVHELLGRLSRWRFGRWWWWALLLQPLLLVVVAAGYNLVARGDRVGLEPGLTPTSVTVSLAFLVLAATGEEIGWRGHALPRLLRRYGALRASAALGLATTAWHLPYWLVQGVLDDLGWSYLALDVGFVVALTFQLTWLFSRTAGSVLAAVALHVSFNLVNVTLLPVTGIPAAFALLTVVELAVAVAVTRRGLGRTGRSSPWAP